NLLNFCTPNETRHRNATTPRSLAKGLALLPKPHQYCSQPTARTPTRRSSILVMSGSTLTLAWNPLTLSPAQLRTRSFEPERKTFSKRLRNHSKRRCCFVGPRLQRRV